MTPSALGGAGSKGQEPEKPLFPVKGWFWITTTAPALPFHSSFIPLVSPAPGSPPALSFWQVLEHLPARAPSKFPPPSQHCSFFHPLLPRQPLLGRHGLIRALCWINDLWSPVSASTPPIHCSLKYPHNKVLKPPEAPFPGQTCPAFHFQRSSFFAA